MMELSRARGRNAAMPLLDPRAQSGVSATFPDHRNQPLQQIVEKIARKIWVCAGVLALAMFAGIAARAQQQQTPTAPAMDIYQSGTPQPVEQAVQKLYALTAEITQDPSSFYLQTEVDKSNWPAVDQAQAQWYNAMAQAGTELTQDQRNNIVPCVAHLNAAIDDMKRGYIIQITQESNPAAQSDAQLLYGEGKKEFAKCLASSVETDDGGTPGPTAGNTPGTTGGSTPGTPNEGDQGTPPLGSPGTPQSGTPPSNSGTKPPLKANATSGPSQGGPGTQPTATNGTPDPGNYPLGIMIGLSNCIKSLPNLLSGLGYFMQGDFADAATSWGIDPKLGGPTVLQKELSVPVIGSNGKTLVPNNLTRYQQGVIDGQRLCGYTLSGLAGKGLGAAAKNVATRVGLPLKGGVGATGAKPVGGGPTPGEPGAPGGNGTGPTEPAPGEPSGEPPVEDKTPVTNPAPSSTEPTTIRGGVSAQDPIRGNALKSALTNNGPNNVSDAPALANKYVQLSDGPVKLGDYINQGSFASVFKDGANLVRKVAKNSGAGYFNDQLEGQANGSQVLQKLGIDHPEVTEFEPGNDNEPASLAQQNAAQKYPGSQELSSGSFQRASAAMQNEMLGAVKSVVDKLASSGYVMGDINPANFTMFDKGGLLEAIPHDTDMIMTLDEINKAFRDPTSTAPSVLNGSLGASGAKAYAPGSYATAQALANQLFIGLEDWLYNGPPKAPPIQ